MFWTVSDAKKVRATGRGLQPNGVRVRDVADFKIHTEGAGEGTPEVRIIGPGKTNICLHEVITRTLYGLPKVNDKSINLMWHDMIEQNRYYFNWFTPQSN